MERDVVRELAALSGRALPLLEAWRGEDPGCGVGRALWVQHISSDLSDTELKDELVIAHRDALAVGEREASVVYGVFLYTHGQYRMTADHLLDHFAQWPGDETAALMLRAFHACGDPAYGQRGDALIEEQYARAGQDCWPWAGQMAWTRLGQGRIDEAHHLAQHTLSLYPRAGAAAHARAHAEHEQGTGRAAIAFLDGWLAQDPQAVQFRHLNWHAALQSLTCGEFADTRRRANDVLARADVGMRAATNWRLLLAGQQPARLSDLEHVRELLAAPGGMTETFHTFNLALALACEAATDDLEALARRCAADERSDYRDVLAPVVAALAQVCAGHPSQAVELLQSLEGKVQRLGGTRVECEIVQDTLARALIDAGDPARAAALLHERVTTRRHHTYEDLLLTPRAHATAGVPEQIHPSAVPAR